MVRVLQREQTSGAEYLQVLGTLAGSRNTGTEIKYAVREQITYSFTEHSKALDFFLSVVGSY